jgi:hypothetical protein
MKTKPKKTPLLAVLLLSAALLASGPQSAAPMLHIALCFAKVKT